MGGQHRVCKGFLSVLGLLLLHITRVHLCFPLLPCLHHHSSDLPVTSPTTPVTSNDWMRHVKAEHRISSRTEAGETLVPILSVGSIILHCPCTICMASQGHGGHCTTVQAIGDMHALRSCFSFLCLATLGCLSLEYDTSSCL